MLVLVLELELEQDTERAEYINSELACNHRTSDSKAGGRCRAPPINDGM